MYSKDKEEVQSSETLNQIPRALKSAPGSQRPPLGHETSHLHSTLQYPRIYQLLSFPQSVLFAYIVRKRSLSFGGLCVSDLQTQRPERWILHRCKSVANHMT